MAGSAHEPLILFRLKIRIESGRDSRVGRLEAELVDGHSPYVDRRIVKCERNDQPDDIDLQWLALAPLAAKGVDGVSANSG